MITQLENSKRFLNVLQPFCSANCGFIPDDADVFRWKSKKLHEITSPQKMKWRERRLDDHMESRINAVLMSSKMLKIPCRKCKTGKKCGCVSCYFLWRIPIVIYIFLNQTSNYLRGCIIISIASLACSFRMWGNKLLSNRMEFPNYQKTWNKM